MLVISQTLVPTLPGTLPGQGDVRSMIAIPSIITTITESGAP
jgi:hypothetical protein